MTRNIPSHIVAAAVIGGLLVGATPALAQNPVTKAEKTRDRAIAKLEAWKMPTAENILKNDKKKAGETQPWATADGLLTALKGLSTNESEVKKGLDILTRQAEKDPADPIAEYYRGMVLTWLGQTDDARPAWRGTESRARALIEKDPKDANAQFYLAAALIRQKKAYNEARGALEKAAAEGFDQAMVDFQTGLSYLLQEKWQQAKDAFDAVADADPRYAHLYYYRGLAWDKLGRTDSLLIDLDQFVKLAPDAPEAKTARAILSSVG